MVRADEGRFGGEFLDRPEIVLWSVIHVKAIHHLQSSDKEKIPGVRRHSLREK